MPTHTEILFEKIASHIGHHIEAVTYGNDEVGVVNASIECEDCGEVIIDQDKDETP